jgi:putative spermidine/putrescine transport system substrate-binding protein
MKLHRPISRRLVLSSAAKTALGAGVAVLVGGYKNSANAASPTLSLVQWGGVYVEAQNKIADQFTKDTGIPTVVELHSGGSGTVIARIQSDLPEIKRDVIAAWDGVWHSMDVEGWLAPLTPDKVSGISRMYDSALFKGPKSGEIVALGWGAAEFAWVYRGDLFPKDLQPLDNYEKLFDPQLKGKVAIGEISFGQGVNLWLPAVAYGGSEKNVEPGWTFLKKLAQSGNISATFGSESQATQLLSSGDAWVLPIGLQNLAGLLAQGVNLKRDKSENMKSFLSLEGFCAMKGPRLNEAYKWLDYFFTGPNVGSFCQAISEPPLHKDAKVTGLWEGLSQGDELSRYGYTPDFGHLGVHLDEWTKGFETEVLPLMKK